MTRPLDTGPFCCVCEIHRVAVRGTKCPGCLADHLKEIQR